jgi:hypothetical protein
VLAVVTGFPSTLFAVLGGVSAVLSTRRYVSEDRPLAATASVAARGLVLALFGLVLGFVSPLIAVVLLYYGLSLMIVSVLMHLATPVLVALTVLLAVGTPHLIIWAGAARPDTVGELAYSDPLDFLVSVFVTGSYPVVTWLAFMLIGVCVGRVLVGTPAHRRVVSLAITGGALAAAGFIADLASRSAVVGALRESGASLGDAEQIALGHDIQGPMGSPVGPGWMAVLNAAAHSGSTADILRTAGVAVLVIAILLLMTARFGDGLPLVLRPVASAGAAPLTIYTLHVFVATASLAGSALFGILFHVPITSSWWMIGPVAILLHVAGALLVGFVLWRTRRRGPLETVVSAIARRAARDPETRPKHRARITVEDDRSTV